MARVVATIASPVKETHELIVEARGRRIGIRNEKTLRYQVPPSIWEFGVSISDWVDEIAKAGATS